MAEAPVKALGRLLQNKQDARFEVFNLGTGNGFTVLEAIRSFEKTNGIKLPYRVVGRRSGDVAQTYASTQKANQALNGKAERDIDDMAASAWQWEQQLRGIKTTSCPLYSKQTIATALDMNSSSNMAISTLTAQAPGRINLIGEHTDYNDGYVLPAAIDKYLTVKLKVNTTDTKVKITASDLGESFTFDLQDFSPARGGWPNYVMGVVHELQQKGASLKGFDAEFESQVPIGSGMSSSAALECSFAIALNEQFSLGFSQWELIHAAQMAEHNFVGTRCGIMDQFASVMGQKDKVMLLDCRSLEFEYFPLELGAYQLLLLNTNVSHSLASSAYNTRRAACEEGAAIINEVYTGIQSLRDVNMEQLMTAKAKLPPTVFKRCYHVVSENQRVLQAAKALADSNHRLLGKLMYQSHTSLEQDFEVSCPELDFLVQQTLDVDFVLGSRMMGGGFGGCTINLIEQQRAEAFVDTVSKRYKNQFGLELTPVTVSIGNGAQTIRKKKNT